MCEYDMDVFAHELLELRVGLSRIRTRIASDKDDSMVRSPVQPRETRDIDRIKSLERSFRGRCACFRACHFGLSSRWIKNAKSRNLLRAVAVAVDREIIYADSRINEAH